MQKDDVSSLNQPSLIGAVRIGVMPVGQPALWGKADHDPDPPNAADHANRLASED